MSKQPTRVYNLPYGNMSEMDSGLYIILYEIMVLVGDLRRNVTLEMISSTTPKQFSKSTFSILKLIDHIISYEIDTMSINVDAISYYLLNILHTENFPKHLERNEEHIKRLKQLLRKLPLDISMININLKKEINSDG